MVKTLFQRIGGAMMNTSRETIVRINEYSDEKKNEINKIFALLNILFLEPHEKKTLEIYRN